MNTKSKKLSEMNYRTWKDPETREKRIEGLIKGKYKGKNKIDIFNSEIIPLLNKGLSANKISKEIGFSTPTIVKLIKEFGNKQQKDLLLQNRLKGKASSGDKLRGKPKPYASIPWEEKYGPEKAKLYKKRLSERMKKDNIINKPGAKKKMGKSKKAFYKKHPEKHANYILAKSDKITKPQRELYEFIKQYYPEATLTYSVKTNESVRYPDIALPSLKIDIEYDGSYWHTNKEKDNKRDQQLLEVGWKTIRVNNLNNLENILLLIKEIRNG